MDSELLVVPQIDDGRRLVDALTTSGFDLSVALWVWPADDGSVQLYIASPEFGDAAGFGRAYAAVYTAMSRLPDLSVTLADLTLVTPDHPVAAAAIRVRAQNPSPLPIRYRGPTLGGMAIEEAYIYPRA
jgi:hypothetical protein